MTTLVRVPYILDVGVLKRDNDDAVKVFATGVRQEPASGSCNSKEDKTVKLLS